jgi:hypothetical protein
MYYRGQCAKDGGKEAVPAVTTSSFDGAVLCDGRAPRGLFRVRLGGGCVKGLACSFCAHSFG